MANPNTFDIKPTLKSPDPEFSLESQGKNFPTASFSEEEADLLQRQLNEMMYALPSSTVADVIQQRSKAIALAATFAKQTFDEKLFGGMNAGDSEIAFDVLRPGHIRSDPADGSTINDWYFEPSSAGWNDWIGNGGPNNYTFGEDQVSVILGMVDQDVSTEVSGINVQDFGRNTDMLPKDLSSVKLRDNERELAVTPLPTLMGQENDSVHIRLQHDAPVESQPRLLGFTFGVGRYMNNEEY